MRSLLTISLFAVSIALGAWGVLDSRQEIQDNKAGVDYLNGSGTRLIVASLLVGGMSFVSLQAGRRHRRRQLRRGDFDFLSGQLISLGLEEVDIEELHTALKADPPMEIVRKRFTVTGDSFSAGDQVSAWTIKMLERRAEQVDRETLEQWEQLVGTAILEYYGWD